MLLLVEVGPVAGTLGGVVEVLGALACGCGCKFYDVGSCETRFTTECEVIKGSHNIQKRKFMRW